VSNGAATDVTNTTATLKGTVDANGDTLSSEQFVYYPDLDISPLTIRSAGGSHAHRAAPLAHVATNRTRVRAARALGHPKSGKSRSRAPAGRTRWLVRLTQHAFVSRGYAAFMESARIGELVTVADGGRPRDGIVFDRPSPLKAVVAVVDRRRGPVFRTVHPKVLTERSEEGPDDPALRRLLRRTPPPVQGGRGGGSVRRGQPGHRRAATHRTTGR
jgi:hypothetical protein